MESKRGIYFVIGGARSGKTRFALGLGMKGDGPRAYVATAEPGDPEMIKRIEMHRRERGLAWDTVEEPLDIRGRIGNGAGYPTAVIDCVTLWVSNLIEDGHDDNAIIKEAEGLIQTIGSLGMMAIVISNEVGLGIVPDNSLARRFRDIAGIVNQRMAEAAKEVFFMASGIAMRIK
jgi:adenosylcobinamide kinase/adenosylcobinamide-phosphate guanylyltransferase